MNRHCYAPEASSIESGVGNSDSGGGAERGCGCKRLTIAFSLWWAMAECSEALLFLCRPVPPDSISGRALEEGALEGLGRALPPMCSQTPLPSARLVAIAALHGGPEPKRLWTPSSGCVGK